LIFVEWGVQAVLLAIRRLITRSQTGRAEAASTRRGVVMPGPPGQLG